MDDQIEKLEEEIEDLERERLQLREKNNKLERENDRLQEEVNESMTQKQSAECLRNWLRDERGKTVEEAWELVPERFDLSQYQY